MPGNGYSTILADPPWPEHGGGRIKRGADRHYSLMTIAEINAYLRTANIAVSDNAHLYLWVTNNYLAAGLEVMRQWGFVYKTNICWVKDKIGLGQYFRGQHELCLFGVRGKLPYKIIDGKRAQAPTVLKAVRTIHSKKPDEIYSIVEKVSYPPYLELFARNHRNGWDSVGDQLEAGIKDGESGQTSLFK